ncbi:basic salivary proline-rich protein 4-like, partial [Penaeus monodon]|uniref:basic salivary proline-rich protein 4-like n=1 Tax=Penaeus monodon TaxID=6687 RepID=UPI0018A7683F
LWRSICTSKRFGPPPGFPLASSWPSIVHYLSGPNIYALGTRRHIRPPEPAEAGGDRSSWRVPDLRPPRRPTGREEYRLFARREGHAGEGKGSAGASELGFDRGLGPVPRSRQAPEERPSGGQDEGTGGSPDGRAGKRPPPKTRSGGRTRRRFQQGTGPQTPDVSPTRRGDRLRGEDSPPPTGRRRGPLPALAPSAEASGTGSRHARCRLPAGRRTESPSSIFESPPV